MKTIGRSPWLISLVLSLLLAGLLFPQVPQAAAAASGENRLSSLYVSGGSLSPAFDPDVTNYEMTVSYYTSSVTVTASTYSSLATLAVNGTTAPNGASSQPVSLSVGSNNTITISVFAEDHSVREYVVDVTRSPASNENRLQSLQATPGIMYPDFDPDIEDYTLYVDHETEKVSLTAFPMDENAIMLYEGYFLTIGQPYEIRKELPDEDESDTDSVIELEIKSESGVSRTYELTVKRAGESVELIDPSHSSPYYDNRNLDAPYASKVTTVESDGGSERSLLLILSTEQLETQLKDEDSASVTIDAVKEGKADLLQAAMKGDLLNEAAARNKSVVIRLDGAAFALPSGWLGQLAADDDIVLKAGTSFPLKLSAERNGTPVMGFNMPVQVTLERLNAGQSSERGELKRQDAGRDAWEPAAYEALASGWLTFPVSAPGTYDWKAVQSSFSDTTGHWASAAIDRMAAKGMVQGVAADRFMPDAPITRAQFTSLLVRALGLSGDASGAERYADVAPDAWFARDVAAASIAGIAAGTADGRFDPDALVTREQMAVMLVKAYAYAAKTTVAELVVTKPAAYADAEQISPWALRSVQIAAEAELMSGNSDGTFAPGASATRAEAAAVVERLLERTAGMQ